MSSARKIGFKEALGFGVGDCYGGGQLTLIATYLSLFWTRFCGMDIATAQTVIGCSAVVSAFAALVMGVLDDNLYRFRIGRRYGRRRLLLLVVSPLLLIGVLLWVPGLPLAAYAGLYVIWVVLAQAFQTAYNPLPGEMTTDFNGRTKLSTVRMFLSTATGTMIPLGCGLVLAIFGENSPVGYMVFAIAATVMFSGAVAAAWHSTWELTPEQAGFGVWERGEVRVRHMTVADWWRRGVRVLGEYASTLRISTFRKHLLIYLLVQMSMDVFGQTFVFFVVYDWNRTAAFASLLLGFSAVSLPLMPLFAWLLDRIGPKRLYAVNFSGMLIGLAWLFAAWMASGRVPEPWWTVLAVCGALWFFVFKSLCGYVPWAVFPLVVDVDQIVSKRYRSATFSGLQACCRQLGSGVATVVVGIVLAAVGFDSTRDAQPLPAKVGLAAVVLGWFTVAMVVCWVVSSRLRIDRTTDLVVLRETTRLRNGGSKADAAPEVRRIVESLTGLPYERCWR